MTDRWCEFDIRVFDPDHLEEQCTVAIARLAPLLNGGDNGGLILCCGWLADLALVFTGDLTQELPWTSHRLEHWHGRSYADLTRLVATLRRAADDQSLPWLRVGPLFCGHGRFVFPDHHDLYDFEGVFLSRHPECYAPASGNEYDFQTVLAASTLSADDACYAAWPDGIPAGTPWITFFAKQWAALAEAVGFNALLLRDGMPGNGGPDCNDATAVSKEVVRKLKEFAPSTMVIGYSGPSGPIRSRRSGGMDLARLAADGQLDAWITQSWGGAWQDWWNSQSAGWTFQHAHILAERAEVRREASSITKHYHLIETFDAFEPWDTITRHRGKLAWAVQAFAHAVTIAADGSLKAADGVYISWLSNREGYLMSEENCNWLGAEIDRAQASADALQSVHGVALVEDPQAIEALPKEIGLGHAGETMYDLAGWLMKWGLGIAGSAKEPTPGLADGWYFGLSNLELMPEEPYMVSGPVELVGEKLLAGCGVTARERVGAAGFVEFTGEGLPPSPLSNMPRHRCASAARPILSVGDDVIFAEDERGCWWLPPVRHARTNLIMPNIIGSFANFQVVAQRFAERVGGPRLRPVALHEPVTFLAWTSGDRLHLLLGNTESGHIGDARHPRSVEVIGLEPGARFVDQDSSEEHDVDDFGELGLVVPAEGRLLLVCQRS